MRKLLLDAPNQLTIPQQGLQFYGDFWHPEQQGFGTLTNGTGIATPSALVAGANTVTVTQLGTFTIWLPSIHTGTVASGTCTVTGSPVSLVGGNNTITTTTATGTITVTCTDQVVDRSTNSLLCTAVGSPVWSNQGRIMDDNDDYFIVPHSSSLTFTTESFTFLKWIQACSTCGEHFILQKGVENASGYRWYISGNTMYFGTSQAAAEQLSAATASFTSLNTWYLMSVTRDGASVILRRNLTNITTTSASHVNLATNTADLIIGVYRDKAYGNWGGKIGEDLIYQPALSLAEITQIYNAIKGQPRYQS